MEWHIALTLLLGVVCVTMFSGLPVALAFFTGSVLGTALFIHGDIGLVAMPSEILNAVSFSLSPIMLFLLMGEILLQTGVAFKAIGAIERLILRVPGRLAIVSLASGTAFATLSGSSIANTAMLGSVLLPEMKRRGYQPGISMGPIMAVGGIAMLIPPSALAVLLASMAEKSVSQLLIGGIIPGLLMAFLFVGYTIVRCIISRELAPSYTPDETYLDEPITISYNRRGETCWSRTYSGRHRRTINRFLPFVFYVLPLSTIFVVIVGSIVFKLAAPTEASAFGVVAALAVCYFFRLFRSKITITGLDGAEFSWREIWKALIETTKINTMILFVIVGSLVFSQALANSGATEGLLSLIVATVPSAFWVVVMMMLVLLFLGAFMDQVSMLLLTLPFFLLGSGSLQAIYNIDVIWLMVLMLVVMEISLLTPPFGLLLYVMKGVQPFGAGIGEVIRAALPFVLIQLAVLVLLILVPEVATWLPRQLN